MKVLIGILGFFIVNAAQADRPSIHGMALFGKNATYVSHLPMFHAPHDYQVVMKIALSDQPGSQAAQVYKKLIVDQGGLFTLVPDPLDLSLIVNGKLTEFHAEVFQGHFEKGGESLGFVQVKIEKLILSKKIKPEAESKYQYTIFGEKGEYFAVHEIDGQPSFDTIVSVGAPFQLSIPHCRTRVCADPESFPIQDSRLPLSVFDFGASSGVKNPPVGSQIGSRGAMADVLSTIYFEEDELKSFFVRDR